MVNCSPSYLTIEVAGAGAEQLGHSQGAGKAGLKAVDCLLKESLTGKGGPTGKRIVNVKCRVVGGQTGDVVVVVVMSWWLG